MWIKKIIEECSVLKLFFWLLRISYSVSMKNVSLLSLFMYWLGENEDNILYWLYNSNVKSFHSCHEVWFIFVFGTGTSLTQTQLIVVKVYDKLINTVLILMKKLDLSTRKKTNIEALSVSLIIIQEMWIYYT